MTIYYQKHKQIKGFQFDGTISQLKKELPMNLFSSLFEADKEGNKVKFNMSPHKYINTIINTKIGGFWQMTKIKRRHRHNHKYHRINWGQLTEIKDHFYVNRLKKDSHLTATTIINEMRFIYKYQYGYLDIHKGDYLIPTYRFLKATNQHNAFMQPYLKIIKKQNFEAHWLNNQPKKG